MNVLFHTVRVVATVSSLVVAGAVAYGVIKDRREARERIEAINKNAELDIEAVKRASDRVREEIKSGSNPGTLAEVMNAFDEHYEFEKIAIRF